MPWLVTPAEGKTLTETVLSLNFNIVPTRLVVFDKVDSLFVLLERSGNEWTVEQIKLVFKKTVSDYRSTPVQFICPTSKCSVVKAINIAYSYLDKSLLRKEAPPGWALNSSLEWNPFTPDEMRERFAVISIE